MKTDSTPAPSAHQSTSRRAFLKSAPVAAVAVAFPTAATAMPVDRSTWEVILRRATEADAACDHFHDTILSPLLDAQTAFEKAHGLNFGQPGFYEQRDALHAAHGDAYKVPNSVYEECERLSDVYSDADSELMETPAPDLEALHHKLRIALGMDEGENSVPAWSREYVRQTIDDCHRLLLGKEVQS